MHNHQRIGLGVELVIMGLSLLQLNASSAIAQVIPDVTLGSNPSRVVPNVLVQGNRADRIDGGAIQQKYLFHSFDQFSVGENNRVYFSQPANIETIVSRVTGNDISSIQGTLGVDGNANLFFLNPNGIVFGENARLDIAGSFFASTANRFTFSDGSTFSANNPQVPPLLTINTSLGLQPGGNQQGNIATFGRLSLDGSLTLDANDIIINGDLQSAQDILLRGQDRIQVTDAATRPTFVSANGTLTIEGQQITLTGEHPDSQLLSGNTMSLRANNPIDTNVTFSSGGRVQMTQMDGQPGSLNSDRGTTIYTLDNAEFGNYEGASLQIIASGSVNIPGRIAVNQPHTHQQASENLSLSNGVVVQLAPGNEPTVDIRAGVAPDVLVNFAQQEGFAVNSIDATARPINAINTNINIGQIIVGGGETGVGNVLLTNQYSPNIEPEGDITMGLVLTSGGDLFVDSSHKITLTGAISGSAPSSAIELGEGGNIYMVANDDIVFVPFVENIISIPTSIIVQGTEGGSIHLDSNGTIEFAEGVIGTLTLTNNQTEKRGDISISTRSMSMTQGSSISTQLIGQGKAGNILIDIDGAFVINGQSNSELPPPYNDAITTIISQIMPGTVGDTGDISIQVNSLNIQDGGLITTFNDGEGNSGDIEVTANEFVKIQGIYRITAIPSPSAINSTTLNGNAGSIRIKSEEVDIEDGGVVASIIGQSGNTGTINLDADTVTLSGQTNDIFLGSTSTFVSGIFTTVVFGAIGNGGDINLDIDTLSLRDGGSIQSAMIGTGEAGDINILARGEISLDQGFINSILSPDGKGVGGEIDINSASLWLRNGAQINAGVSQNEFGSGGNGNGGSITIQASERVKISGFRPEGESFVNPITLLPDSTGGINPETPTIPTFSAGGFSSALVTSTGEGATGRGGDISIDTPVFQLADGAIIEALTANESRAGDISIRANRLAVTGGGQIIATTSNRGRAGDITLDVLESAILSGQDPSLASRLEIFGPDNVTNQGPFSGLFSNTQGGSSGKGGNITINTPGRLSIIEGAQLLASTSGQGRAGNIAIGLRDDGTGSVFENAPDIIQLSNSTISSAVEEDARGNGGTIDIDGDQIVLTDNAQILASTKGDGRAGTVTIRSTRLDVLDSQIRTTTESDRRAGDINISVDDEITLSGENTGFLANTTTGSMGNGGNIAITTPGILSLNNNAIISTSTDGGGNAGTVTIREADRVQLVNGATLSSASNQEATGAAGGINIAANTLTVRNRANATVSSRGRSVAGDLNITADTITLRNQALLSAETDAGRGGNIELSGMETLTMQDSRISASTASGTGGNITSLDAENVQLTDSAIAASAIDGRAGNVTLNAAESVRLANGSTLSVETTRDSNTNSQNRAMARDLADDTVVRSPLLNSSLSRISRVDDATINPPQAGNLSITTRLLTVDGDSSIRVDSPTGQAGNVRISANQLWLDNSSISARTSINADRDEPSANVDIQGIELLLLANNSLISAEAEAAANGGNIVLDADGGFIAATPNGNNDLIATADRGNGGNIRITTQQLLGFQEYTGSRDPRQLPSNDMSVTSNLGTDGAIAINDLGLDPVQGAADLPGDTAPPPLSQGCVPGGGQGNFTNAGQSGIPLGPGDVRGSDRAWEDITPSDRPTYQSITEAQTWTINDRGQVILNAKPAGKTALITCQS